MQSLPRTKVLINFQLQILFFMFVCLFIFIFQHTEWFVLPNIYLFLYQLDVICFVYLE